MPEDAESPDQPSDVKETASEEVPAPDAAPDAAESHGVEEGAPVDAAEPNDEPARPDADAGLDAGAGDAALSTGDPLPDEQLQAQPAVVEAGSGDGATAEVSSADADRLAEEQMLAQMAEAEAVAGQEQPTKNDIKEPSMDLSPDNPDPVLAQAAEFPQLSSSVGAGERRSFDMLMDVKLPVSIELGRSTMAIADILALSGGSVVELDKLAGEPVDLLVNDKVIAQGEVVVVDENFGIRITALISPQERIKSL